MVTYHSKLFLQLLLVDLTLALLLLLLLQVHQLQDLLVLLLHVLHHLVRVDVVEVSLDHVLTLILVEGWGDTHLR